MAARKGVTGAPKVLVPSSNAHSHPLHMLCSIYVLYTNEPEQYSTVQCIPSMRHWK